MLQDQTLSLWKMYLVILKFAWNTVIIWLKTNIFHSNIEYDEEELQHKKAIFQFPTLENSNTFKVERERNAIVSLKEALEDKKFYEPVSVDIHFPERQSYRYVFIRNLKKCGIPNWT